MQKSTATVTWTSYRNFGTYLQAYALQKAICNLGYSNKVIDDNAVVSSFPKKRFSPVRILRNIGWLCPARKRFMSRSADTVREFDDFKNRYIDVDSLWNSKEDLATRYDIYIAGSDQIWSPNVRFDDFYYLAFTDRPKIAYAPSLGTKSYPEEKAALVRPYIEKFSALSVREPHGASIMKEIFSKEAEVVADPTMLLDKEDWNALLSDYSTENDSVNEPYALCYLLTYNRRYIEIAEEYCRRTGFRMKLVVTSPDLVGISEDELYVGPLGFLNSARNAHSVLTDSFHGTIFSLIFEKQFYTFKRFPDASPGSQNSRLEHLLSEMGLSDRFLDESTLSVPDGDVDFADVALRMRRMRENSISYLKKSLDMF